MKYFPYLFFALFLCCDSTTTTFDTEDFSISYPKIWKMANEDGGVYNFYPIEDYGAVSISVQKGVDLPMELTKKYILELHYVNGDPDLVEMTKKGDQTEFYFEAIEDNVIWVTKVIRKNSDFYLLTINCEESKWKLEKDQFLQVMNSVKIK